MKSVLMRSANMTPKMTPKTKVSEKTIKREFAINGELTQSYYDNVIFPQVREIQILRYEIKDELHTISKKLFKLQKLLNTMNFHKKQ